MKLFQKLLITPAVLGLLTPLAGSANELNFSEVSGYSSSEEIENIREFDISNDIAASTSNFNEIEPMAYFEAGSFSETTTMSGSASFQVGAVDESVITEAVTATYSYKLDLNTSYTGDDNLYVGIEAGNSSTSVDFALDESVVGDDKLNVASMYYQFPLGNFDVAVGPKLDNDDLMPTTISKYSDSFFFGGRVLLDTGFYSFPGVTGAGVAVSRVFDNGFNVSGSLIGTDASSSAGLITKEGNDVTTLSVGYDADSYGLGLVYVEMDDICGFVAGYKTCASLGANGVASASSIGIGGYWTPNEGKTTLSLTINSVEASVTGLTVEDIYDSQFSIDHEMGEGVLSASIKGSDFWNGGGNNNLVQDYVGEFAEIYYTYPVNDALELSGGVAFAMPDNTGLVWIDRTAVGAGATFKF